MTEQSKFVGEAWPVKKYLIVSLGSIGKRHLRNLRLLCPEAQIAVLRLTASGRADVLPDDADIQFATIDEALAFAPDAAIIASPASAHLQVAMPLVKAKIPLLIEKPLATSCAGLDELLEAAAGIRVMVAYNLRFLPSLIEMRRMILDGAIGNVYGGSAEVGQYLPTWRPASRYQDTVSARQDLGGGALLELSHEFDYLYWMFGLPTWITACGGHFSDLEIDVEDMVSVNLEYEGSSRLIHVHLDLVQHGATRGCKMIGSEGSLRWDGVADTLEHYSPATGQWRRVAVRSCTDRNETYVAELSHFLDCVVSGRVPVVGLSAARDVLAIVDGARASIAGRCSVKVRAYG